eukprot:CAMPEP_0113714066 /NCGR_PEP_ID=MMETSP0038_2-20120614/32378_1 /TAXON_ID=2898 /ORGANISM="Cryptomonas paramecium" /LENGTH=204 /DNA_ID=CAMNT_0000640937 /DNA_START=65 /DNA_END=675 /DNA_ORIENTATION=- /assembly_acc=CAM_ASM_000170
MASSTASRQHSTALPFSEKELDNAVKSLQNLASTPNTIDWCALRQFFAGFAHESHKDWMVTESRAQDLAKLIGGPDDPGFRSIFRRVLEGGGWDAAVAAASSRPATHRPWAVLVTGVNGIRKTTSIYQEWFKQALWESLVVNTQPEVGWSDPTGSPAEQLQYLPSGSDSFFRQLDFIVATVANEEFRGLYQDEAAAAAAAVEAG